jgi:hypothetical protein
MIYNPLPGPKGWAERMNATKRAVSPNFGFLSARYPELEGIDSLEAAEEATLRTRQGEHA